VVIVLAQPNETDRRLRPVGLFRHEATPPRVRLPPHGQQATPEVYVTHFQTGDLTDPQSRGRQDHHAVTPGLMRTAFHGTINKPTERPYIRQCGIPRTLWAAGIGNGGAPTVRRRARSLAGFRSNSPSRTASSSTRTRAAIVFLTVDRP
jgi:hypothetical protein